jgi:hypothetical protein
MSSTKATLRWLAPTSTGGSPVTSYVVSAVPGTGACSTTGALTCQVTQLTNGTMYTFSVVAKTAVGSSTPTTTIGYSFGATVGNFFVYPGANLSGLDFTGLNFGTVDSTASPPARRYC